MNDGAGGETTYVLGARKTRKRLSSWRKFWIQ